MTDYVIDLDDREWIGVPPAFPYLEWADAAAWSAAIADAAIPDDPERRAAFERAAFNVASDRPQDVDHVLWFAPEDGRTMGVAFLSVYGEAPADVDLEEVAMLGIDSPTAPQIASHASERFGTVVQSAATVRLSDVAADPETAQGVAGSIRTVAAASDLLFVLNAVDEDLVTLAIMQQPMIDLFERIELLTDDDAVTDAVRHLAQ
ncbi:hypothetical protein [Microbacterium gallinarum]|jgi:hypothetical protein|uniref:Uncharacterized protein n=1 Tax=Microbacterium gallinarum TaxID=2762209 RepID=A0ABR8X5J3_9MICO|nr:hypothetical protein [Microbacterium gallinarum]MBD8024603.1 hypothetical protein [Microbacterium gallinarum]